jgi:hypothetical protein
MPQLRHAETSALLAESSDALDIVVVARSIGLNKVIFDDVGSGFDINTATDAAADRARLDAESAAWDATLREEIAGRVNGTLERVDTDGPDVTPIAIQP